MHVLEHLMVHGVPVQLVPAYNDLVVDAVQNARLHAGEASPTILNVKTAPGQSGVIL